MRGTAFPRTDDVTDLRAARDAYLRDGQAPAEVRPVVLESWDRSRGYGVSPRHLTRQEPDAERLEAARQASAALLAAAGPFLALVGEVLSGEPHVLALSDPNGLILRLHAGPGLDGYDLAGSNLWEGASWHERDIGCNGIGTCLATGEPVILIGPEHFQESYIAWTCIGAPIRGSSGALAGALDFSVPNENAHVHGWGWTLSLARAIETSLVGRAVPGEIGIGPVAGHEDHSLRSVAATFDLLATKLGASPSHMKFLTAARAELEAAERQREARIHELTVALTERARAEEELARQHEFLERLIDSVPVMVTRYDPAIQEVRLNPHVTKVLGWTNEDARHRDIMELCYPDPDYREEVRRFMQAPGPRWLDIEMTAKDGSKVPTAWANVRLTDHRQVGIGIDLTDRKRSQRELEDAYRKTRDALKERDHVLAVVSHDLRNPLNTLRMASSLLSEDLPEGARKAQLPIIRRSVDLMTRLIEDLLDAARIEGGGLRLDPRPCPADELIGAALAHMTPLAQAASVALRSEEFDSVRVLADRGRIAQVFGNLIGNAIQHTPAGGQVVLDARARDADEVVFSIRDTGRGIAEADLPRIFDRYWQARKTDSSGAGLGLAIAKGIVESHGGRIWAEAGEQAGSVFHFTLPSAGA
jgi:PAS domain S-box-containing protein